MESHSTCIQLWDQVPYKTQSFRPLLENMHMHTTNYLMQKLCVYFHAVLAYPEANINQTHGLYFAFTLLICFSHHFMLPYDIYVHFSCFYIIQNWGTKQWWRQILWCFFMLQNKCSKLDITLTNVNQEYFGLFLLRTLRGEEGKGWVGGHDDTYTSLRIIVIRYWGGIEQIAKLGGSQKIKGNLGD